MKKISLVLCFALLLVAMLALGVFAATYENIADDARIELHDSDGTYGDKAALIDGDYSTACSAGTGPKTWINYKFYYDADKFPKGVTVSSVRVIFDSTGTISNVGTYTELLNKNFTIHLRLYDINGNASYLNQKWNSIDGDKNIIKTQYAEDGETVLYRYLEYVFDEPVTGVYQVEVPVENGKDKEIAVWEVEIYNYICPDEEHDWVGQLCGEHCDFCGVYKNTELECVPEEDDGDCRTAILCKYCDSVMVASKKHVFANGETVCSNDGCVFEGKNIVKDTSITPVDVTENSYGENGEFMNWWYYSAHITDGKYDTIAHSNYFGQYKFTFTLKGSTKLSEIFIVSNSSGVYHPWGYGHDNLNKDFAVKVIIYDAEGEVIQTVEYQSLDFTNPNVVPIYAENGEMTSVGYKLDANYANAKKIELFINEGVWEVEIYEHVTCDYQFVETVAPGCTTEGYDLYKCACGNEKYENTVAALGHSYDDGVVTKEPGEEEDGIIVYTCQTCGNEKSLAIPATGHEHNYDSYVGISIEPTCAVVGSATYQCRCGDTTEVEIPATGKHDYSVFVEYTKEPTYLADGYANYKCATCDGFVNVNVGRLQMNTAKYAEVVKELGGWTVCEKYLIDGNYNLGSAGSHTTNGWAFSLNYGEDYTFTKLAFVVNSVGKFPSADAFNYTSKTNKDYSFAITLYDANGKAVWSKSTTCAEAVEMTGVDANGNEFLYDILTIEFDEPVVASKLYVKINSGWDNGAGMWEVETYGLPVNYHEVHDYTVFVETKTAATCTTDGLALYRCAKCEETAEVAVSATGHTMGAATCTAPATCSVCGATEGEALGHTMSAATCTAPATCSVCGATEGEALGHTWADATCTAPKTCSVCGATDGEALGQHIYDLSNAVTDGNVITIACTNGCGAAATITVNGTKAQAGFNMMMQQAVVSVYAPGYGMLSATTSEGSSCFLITNPRLPAQSFTAPMIVNIDGFNDTYVIVPQFSSTDAAPSITITYEALTPATIVEGENTVDTSKGDTKVQFVVVESGKYNFVLNADAVILTEYGSVATCEGPFEYEAGDVIEIIVMPYGAPSIDITVEKIVEHTHTEEIIPAVLPTPSTEGFTAGIICSDCGETIKAPIAINVTEMANTRDPAFRVASANLSLQENISVNYWAIVTEGYNNPYMVFVFNGKEYIVTDYKINPSNGRLGFNFAETFPQFMNSNIEAYVYAETAEGEYSMNKILEYSVKQYCISQLKKNDAALTTVISDVLTLGAMTQVYVGYKTNELVTDIVKAEGYTLTPTAFTGIPADVDKQVVSGTAANTDLKGASLLMGSSTEIKLTFVSEDLANTVIKVNFLGEEKSFTSEDFAYDATSGRHYIIVNYIRSYEYNEVLTATIELNGEQVGRTIEYSINTYLYRNVDKAGQTDAAKNLMKALYVYGVTIANYFN